MTLDVHASFCHKRRAGNTFGEVPGPSNPTSGESNMRLNSHATGAPRAQDATHIGDAANAALADIVARNLHFRLQLVNDALATFDLEDDSRERWHEYLDFCQMYYEANDNWPMDRAAAAKLVQRCLTVIARKERGQ